MMAGMVTTPTTGTVIVPPASVSVMPASVHCAIWPSDSSDAAPLLTMLTPDRKTISPSVSANRSVSLVGTSTTSSQAAITSAPKPVTNPSPGTIRTQSSASRTDVHVSSGQNACSIGTTPLSGTAAGGATAGSRSSILVTDWLPALRWSAVIICARDADESAAGTGPGRDGPPRRSSGSSTRSCTAQPYVDESGMATR